jgi:hypothetical protein
MALTAQEMAGARKAYTGNHECDQYSKYPFWIRLGVLAPAFVSVSNHWGKMQPVDATISILFFCFIISALVLIWRRIKRLQFRYAENMRMLDELRKREGGKLPQEIEDGIYEEHPLVEYWSRRLEKRAILWRLDAFLSRKPISV